MEGETKKLILEIQEPNNPDTSFLEIPFEGYELRRVKN